MSDYDSFEVRAIRKDGTVTEFTIMNEDKVSEGKRGSYRGTFSGTAIQAEIDLYNRMVRDFRMGN
jgi:hypothetical protein